MGRPGLTISLGTLNGVPLIKVHGAMEAWSARTVGDMIDALLAQGASALTLDLLQASFPDSNSLSLVAHALGAVSLEMSVVTVADTAVAGKLRRANLQPIITICSNLDQASETLRWGRGYISSRWVAQTANDEGIPLAA